MDACGVGREESLDLQHEIRMKEMRDKKYKVKPNFMDIHPTGEHFEAYENIELKQFLVLVKSREIAKVMEFFGYAPRE
eukprot:8710520-Pyramimonas_sp.AAC.1